jgi:hypothetical protein
MKRQRASFARSLALCGLDGPSMELVLMSEIMEKIRESV